MISKEGAQTEGSQPESELIKAAKVMSIFRYMSEKDTEEDQLTVQKLQENIGLTPQQIMLTLLDYMHKYPELLEFPNGVQNISALFDTDLSYNIDLFKKFFDIFGECANIALAKD